MPFAAGAWRIPYLSQTRNIMAKYKLEYIWLDGYTPLASLRSKTQIKEFAGFPKLAELPDWGFDGSSTQQAEGKSSDVVLKPVAVFPDSTRKNGVLVMCETYLHTGEAHPSNSRATIPDDPDTWFGFEQEYFFYKDGAPLGFPVGGFPAPQGFYYCGVGADEVYGRDIVEAHLDACLIAGLGVSGINAEVMPGQWEFQIGPVGTVEVGDHLWVARWLLYRIAEEFGVSATLDPKPVKGDWNGAGAHTNFSTKAMRESYDPIIKACEALGKKADEHVKNYGADIEHRLTGMHETAPWHEFSYGVSDRGASIRIPWQVAVEKRGYLEDRRPNANIDPYVVARLMVETVCGAMK